MAHLDTFFELFMSKKTREKSRYKCIAGPAGIYYIALGNLRNLEFPNFFTIRHYCRIVCLSYYNNTVQFSSVQFTDFSSYCTNIVLWENIIIVFTNTVINSSIALTSSQFSTSAKALASLAFPNT